MVCKINHLGAILHTLVYIIMVFQYKSVNTVTLTLRCIVLIGKGRAASEIKRPVKQSLMFSPRDRELSAKRHTIKKLENSLTDTKRELNELKKENRLLNRLQVRQEKEIDRFQTQEGELPEILARHAEEVAILL